MVIDTLTIIVSIVIIVLSIISAMTNPLFRMPKADDGDDENENRNALPPLSVIILVGDYTDTLERNLPLILGQEYEPGYQVIVVAHEGDSLADDMMKRYKDTPNLKSTFIPKSSFYISREKLGVTLGVKAAKNEWCLLMDAKSYPESSNWLKEIGKECTEDRNLVLGYCNFDNESKAFQRFARLRRFAYLWREAKSGTPYCANHSNLVFRKSEFISEDGYRGNVECVRGEFDFIVNRYAKKGMTGIVCSADGSLTEVAPTDNQWHHRRMFFIHSSKRMGHGFCHKALGVIDSLLLHLTWISCIAIGAVAGLLQNWIILGAAALALIINIVWRTLDGKKAAERLNTEIPTGSVVWLELTSVWHTLSDKIRYKRANKYDFTCHKL